MEIRRTTRARLAWLEKEASRWRDEGTIDEDTRARIVGAYEAAALVRGTMVLLVLAVLMFGIGVLLLIGYNWHRIPPSAKIAMILSAVAAAFIASAVAYAKQRPAAGESLALLGTFLYGNGIWLVAQVLHIQGYFPDAFLWFAIGAGLCAFLLRSTLIGVETALLLVAWVFASGAASSRPAYLFVLLWPAVLALTYRLRSPVALGIAAFAAPLWAFASTVQISGRPLFVGAAAITGCALYAVADWHRDGNRMKPAWQVAGLFPLLLMFIPLLATEVHRGSSRPATDAPPLVFIIVIAAGVVAATMLRRKPRDAATASVAVVSMGLFAWSMLLATGLLQPEALWVIAATIAFSALALLLAVAFIRTALRTSSPYDFAFGVLFAVVFLVVRWTSVIDNMFLSGVIMVSAGAGLLFAVRLWRQRDHALALHGRV